MTPDPYVDDGPGRELVEAGADIAGSAVGAAVGLVFAGPPGAIGGAIVGPAASRTLRHMATEIGQRVLGRRERARAGAAVIYAAERLQEYFDSGSTIRQDGFFDDLPSGRNVGREVAEGVLLAARDAFEERKVRHIGYLFANVAIHEDIDGGLATLALGRAEALTWRQYVLLAAVERADRLSLPAGQIGDDAGEWTKWGARRELNDLFEAGYLRAPPKKTARMGLRYPNTVVGEQRLAHQGLLLHQLLSLDLMTDGEVLVVHESLRLSTVAGAGPEGSE